MTARRVFSKLEWHKAVGLQKKPKRLKLTQNPDGKFYCPVSNCETEGYYSKRVCRKHIYQRHGWFYFFDRKPSISEYFPEASTRNNKLVYNKPKRSNTSQMPTFLLSCSFGIAFTTWLSTPGGGGKDVNQANQISSKVLKYLKYCCDDVCSSWDIPMTVIDYCMGSVSMMSEFVTCLQDNWNVGYAGVIGYMNALSHVLDFRRFSIIDTTKIPVFLASEVYLDRVKKCLSKKMKIQWNTVLSVEHLSSMNCWSSLDDMQRVIPFHADKFSQIVLNCSDMNNTVPPHDLSFATSFIVAVLFLMVKASRPMSFEFLTVPMIQKLPKEGGIIDQTQFKTQLKYGFDSLLINEDVLQILTGYIECIRPRFQPSCEYMLVTRTGRQLKQLGYVFGRIVYTAIGKHIHPTRYRQIVETESATMLNEHEQSVLSKDQKHTSHVARVHYQKMQSREIAVQAQKCMNKLIGNKNPWNITISSGKKVPNSALKTANNVLESVEKVFCNTDVIEKMYNNNKSSVSDVDITVERVNNATHHISNSQSSLHSQQHQGESIIVDSCKPVRQRKVPFSKEEDGFLVKGMKKYGPGRWTSILSDCDYTFQSSRKASTLYLRAKKLKLF